MRQRKKKSDKSEAKKKDKEIPLVKNKQRPKVVTLLAKGNCLIGALFHVDGLDNTSEFDPFFIERIKNCMQLMAEK